jgi:tRNA/rRNA methyltransferase
MNLKFILVEPKVPENIGSAARALKVTGAGSLVLVNPLCQLSGKALWVAHGSEEIVTGAPRFGSLEEALRGSDFSVATTARARSVKCDPVGIHGLNAFLRDKRSADETVAIVFGREESGLTNKEISLCDISSFIPMAVQFPSLNLAQAVLIYAYELSASAKAPGSRKIKKEPGRDSSEAPLHILKEKAAAVLRNIEIPENDARYGRIMERLGHLSPADQRLMLTVSGKLLTKCVEGEVQSGADCGSEGAKTPEDGSKTENS